MDQRIHDVQWLKAIFNGFQPLLTPALEALETTIS